MSVVSRETIDRLEKYEDLIRRWNPHINLVASASLPDLRDRHIADCLHLAKIIQPSEGEWLDLGSGGGLPGIVLAVAYAAQPTRFVLVESDQRKAAFLRTVIRELSLSNASVANQRIEAMDRRNAAYISARALAPLPQLMQYLEHHLAHSGRALLMKGQQWQKEVTDAKEHWNFNVVAHPSGTRDGAATLEISEVSHV